jgi:hypothetical protein
MYIIINHKPSFKTFKPMKNDNLMITERPALLNNIIPFLTDTEYSKILCTCKLIDKIYDRNYLWNERMGYKGNEDYDGKKTCFLKQMVSKYGISNTLEEQCSVKALKQTCRLLSRFCTYQQMVNAYFEHMHSTTCLAPSWIRLEAQRLSFANGTKLKFSKKRKILEDSPLRLIRRRVTRCLLVR